MKLKDLKGVLKEGNIVLYIGDIYHITYDNTTRDIWGEYEVIEMYPYKDINGLTSLAIEIQENNEQIEDKILSKFKQVFNDAVKISFHKNKLYVEIDTGKSLYVFSDYINRYNYIDMFIEGLKKDLNKNV